MAVLSFKKNGTTIPMLLLLVVASVVPVFQQFGWMMERMNHHDDELPNMIIHEALIKDHAIGGDWRIQSDDARILPNEASSTSTTTIHDIIKGQHGDFGFFYIGLGDGDSGFCTALRTSTRTLRTASSCFAQGSCKVAFIGDEAGRNRIQRDCPEPFDAILERNITGCLDTVDIRARKLCIRARGLLPFTYNVFLDADTLIPATERNSGLELIFDVLVAGFEYAAAWECCTRSVFRRIRPPKKHEALMRGWELQTGVLGLTNSRAVQKHAEVAIDITQQQHTRKVAFTSAEQSFETLALARSDVRVFTLPPNFNMRSYTVEGYRKMPINVLHVKDKKDIESYVKEFNLKIG